MAYPCSTPTGSSPDFLTLRDWLGLRATPASPLLISLTLRLCQIRGEIHWQPSSLSANCFSCSPEYWNVNNTKSYTPTGNTHMNWTHQLILPLVLHSLNTLDLTEKTVCNIFINSFSVLAWKISYFPFDDRLVWRITPNSPKILKPETAIVT